MSIVQHYFLPRQHSGYEALEVVNTNITQLPCKPKIEMMIRAASGRLKLRKDGKDKNGRKIL